MYHLGGYSFTFFHTVDSQVVKINTVTDSNHNYAQFAKWMTWLWNKALSLCSVLLQLHGLSRLSESSPENIHSDKRGSRSCWGVLLVSVGWNLCQTLGHDREPSLLQGTQVSSFVPGMLEVLVRWSRLFECVCTLQSHSHVCRCVFMFSD